MWKLPPPESKAAEVWIDSLEDEDNRLFLLDGAVRASKTAGSAIAWADFCQNGPPGPLMMLGNSERTLRRNVLDPLREFLGPRKFRLNAGLGEAYIFGRKVYLVGANNIGALPKVQGPTLVGAYCDEAATYPADVFSMLISRLSLPGAKLWATMNPAGPGHWMKKNYIDRAGKIGARHWHFTLDDNPFLDEGYKAWLKSTYTGLWRKRYIDGLWALADGLIFENFDPDKHVIKSLPAGRIDQMRIGIDYGASNPTCFLKALRYDDKWVLASEYYHRPKEQHQKTNSEYAAALKQFIGELYPTSVEIDPSAAAFIHEARRAGVRGVHPADNSVLAGLQKMAEGLQSGRWLIHESCKNLIEELQGYAWDPKAQEKGEDKPIKSSDHAIDAWRYIINATS